MAGPEKGKSFISGRLALGLFLLLALLPAAWQCKKKPAQKPDKAQVLKKEPSGLVQIYSSIDKDVPRLKDGSAMQITALGGTSETDVVAVGEQGFVMVKSGASWTVLEPVTQGDLRAVSACAPGKSFIVGRGAALFRDGKDLRPTEGIKNSDDLTSVWAESCSKVFAAGMGGVLYRYQKGAWSAMESPTPQDLFALWGSSGKNVFASGASGTLLHYDGKTWKHVPVSRSAQLFGLSGLDKNEVFVGGGELDYGLVLRCTAQACKIVFEDTAGYIENIVALPQEGTQDPKIMVLSKALPGHAGTSVSIFQKGLLRDLDVEERNEEADDYFINDIWSDGKNLWAAGCGLWRSSLAAQNPETEPRSVKPFLPPKTCCTGAKGWRPMESGTRYHLEAIWGASWNNRFAVGAEGTILHYDEKAWSAMESPTRAYLTDLWGTGPTNVFAVGTNGTVLHYDGKTWTQQETPTEMTLWAIFGQGPTRVFAVGQDGILSYDGKAWTLSAELAGSGLRGIWAGPDGKFYTAGKGVLYTSKGKAWKKVDEKKHSDTPYNDVGGTASGQVWAIANEWDTENLTTSEYDLQKFGEEELWDSWLSAIANLGDKVTIVGTCYILPHDISMEDENEEVFTYPPLIGIVYSYDGAVWTWAYDRAMQGLTDVWAAPEGLSAVGYYGSIYERPVP